MIHSTHDNRDASLQGSWGSVLGQDSVQMARRRGQISQSVLSTWPVSRLSGTPVLPTRLAFSKQPWTRYEGLRGRGGPFSLRSD